ncbi:terminase TerL endonuclease subunit [uncultured Ruminococcus sp.]|uniref:terminase large subunit n=1 Tax=uncultured Ruminococcus sp. TaxID=165186 RepID=UPI00292F35A8|nr:terminase TerL endonuclease subunit [uncultured Ruminococcus sp.]
MTDRVTEYARAVVAGKVPYVGRLHFLACRRHLRDLERQGAEDFPYRWSVEAADNILNFAETLTIGEGFEKKPVKLIGSQVFDLGCTFGWLRTDNGFRRFRRRYKSVARQNGKSFENGIMGPYIAAFGGYKEGKLFTVATKRRQAKIVWDEMRKFIQSDADLAAFFSIKDYKTTITAENTGCTIEALSKESGLDDGFRAIFASIDELHQHKDGSVYQALWKGTRSLPETLLSVITTRGKNQHSYCKEFDRFCISILEGTVSAEDFFVDIFCPDEGDDIYDINNALKANPLFVGDPDKIEQLRIEAETAKNMGGMERVEYTAKSVNLWTTADDANYVNADDLHACLTEKTLENFRGADCWVGLDLSGGGDLTSWAAEFRDGDQQFFHSHSYMPLGRLQEHIQSDFAPYDLWQQQELITATGGAESFKNDYKFIIRDLKRMKEEYNLNIRAIGVDPHNADGILEDLDELTPKVIIVTQSARNLSDTTVDLKLSVREHKAQFNRNNELLVYSFENAVETKNSFNELKIDKRDSLRGNRIDPVDACIDAHFCYMQDKGEEPVNHDDAMTDYLTEMGW